MFAYWLDDVTVVTGGIKHGLLWNSGNCTSKRLLFGKFPIDTLICANKIGNTLVIGTNGGCLYLFNGNSCSAIRDNHKKQKDGGVFALCNFEDGLISGSKSGNVNSKVKLDNILVQRHTTYLYDKFKHI